MLCEAQAASGAVRYSVGKPEDSTEEEAACSAQTAHQLSPPVSTTRTLHIAGAGHGAAQEHSPRADAVSMRWWFSAHGPNH